MILLKGTFMHRGKPAQSNTLDQIGRALRRVLRPVQDVDPDRNQTDIKVGYARKSVLGKIDNPTLLQEAEGRTAVVDPDDN